MEAEGLACARGYDGGGGMLAITPRGLHQAGYEISSRTTASSVSGLTHGRAVSWIAAHCARKERRWFGPAELRNDGWEVALPRRAGFQAKTRLPDLGLILEGRERWAVEFERVEMPGDRLQRILDGYRRAEHAGQIDRVGYDSASERIARTVRSAIERVPLNHAVRTLDRVIAEARGTRRKRTGSETLGHDPRGLRR